jgi:hypothetical protein
MAYKHVSLANTQAAIEELFEAAFSARSVPRLYSESHREELFNSGSEVNTFGGMRWVRGSRHPVTTRAEEIIAGICYQATANKDKLRILNACCSELKSV